MNLHIYGWQGRATVQTETKFPSAAGQRVSTNGRLAWFDLDSGFNCSNVHKIRTYWIKHDEVCDWMTSHVWSFMLPCAANCDKGVCLEGVVAGWAVELFVYIIHVGIPWKCCHKLALKLGCLVDSLFLGNCYKARGDSCAYARCKACGRKGGKIH
jgi:hypothetical protein